MDRLPAAWVNAAERLGAACLSRGRVLAGAESCTGGLIAATLTAVSGSSAWFDRAFVTYSNAAKVELLGVAPATLDAFGAVSEETAREMALGALRHSGANLAYAVTGIAGPTGGTPDKPVGLVCFGFATAGGVYSVSRRFDGDRDTVRAQSLRLVIERLHALVEQSGA
ncbi:MAG: CinA family protein [Casimicrobiaceae bacterium]